MVDISLKAQDYILGLLVGTDAGTQIRIFVEDFGTEDVRCGVCFCSPDFFLDSDVIFEFGSFFVRIDKLILPSLEGLKVDLEKDGLGFQLTLLAPFLKKISREDKDRKLKALGDVSSLESRVRAVLESKVNPQLAVHGGSVSLVRVTSDFLVFLQFFGGCNGCAMSRYTMTSGIEVILKKNFPELKGVYDITQHSRGSHSYY